MAPSQAALDAAVARGVPHASVAFFARWWQLETWLRELVYLELRAAHGREWESAIRARAIELAGRDAVNAYMGSPDNENLLAYLDVGSLLALIDTDEHWRFWQHAMPRRVVWRGIANQLLDLRNRNAHCRRPHRDDLARIEQTLRDLEFGARRSLSAYNRQSRVADDLDDPVAAAWVRGDHSAARRLIARQSAL